MLAPPLSTAAPSASAGELAAEVAALDQGSHLCLIYDTPEEQLAAVAPYLIAGLARGERCFYVVDHSTAAEVEQALTAAGVDVARAVARGALVLATQRETYLRSGAFDPEAMIAFLQAATEQALADGYTGLRITGEMTWQLAGEEGCERLIEYEALLNRFFPGSRATAICQYARPRFPAETIASVLRTHPVAILGGEVCPNLYYEPPEHVLQPVGAAERVDWMVGQLRRAREAERAVQRSEARLRRLIEAPLLGVCLWSADGLISDANDEFLAMLGLDRAALAADLRWERITPPEYVRADREAATTLQRTGISPTYEKEFWHADGSRVPALVGGVALDQAVTSGIAFVLNISERKLVEAERERLYHAERAARAEAEAASRMKDEFLSVAAHELKTPVTVIQGYSEILARLIAGGAPPNAAMLDVIGAECDRLTRLIEDLLTVSRLALGRLELRPARFDLCALVQELATRTAPLSNAHQLVVEAPARLVVTADRDRIEHVLANLLSNAIRYAPDGGVITLTVAAEAERAVVTVCDPGIGIPLERQRRVFERFFRAHEDEHRDRQGLGIGLHLSRELIRQHAGDMWFASAPGHGSTFAFSLPALAATAPAS